MPMNDAQRAWWGKMSSGGGRATSPVPDMPDNGPMAGPSTQAATKPLKPDLARPKPPAVHHAPAAPPRHGHTGPGTSPVPDGGPDAGPVAGPARHPGAVPAHKAPPAHAKAQDENHRVKVVEQEESGAVQAGIHAGGQVAAGAATAGGDGVPHMHNPLPDPAALAEGARKVAQVAKAGTQAAVAGAQVAAKAAHAATDAAAAEASHLTDVAKRAVAGAAHAVEATGPLGVAAAVVAAPVAAVVAAPVAAVAAVAAVADTAVAAGTAALKSVVGSLFGGEDKT